MPEQPPKSVEKLADDINELESLIAAKKGAAHPAGSQVPILDDVVEADAAPDSSPARDASPVELEERLLRRLDAELAELAVVIREIMRRCVREELRADAEDRTPAEDKSEPAG